MHELYDIDTRPNPPQKRSSLKSYFWAMVVTLSLTITLLIVNGIFSDTFMSSSIYVSVELQRKVNLKAFSFVFSYVIFAMLFAYIFILYTLRQDIERSLVMIFSLCMLIYLQALIKLIYANERPIFLSSELDSANCTCDYGQPSGHALSSSGICLLIFDDIRHSLKPRMIWRFLLGFALLILTLAVCFSRIYFGVHSYNQIALGLGFGISIFFLIKLLQDILKKYCFGPICQKGKYANQWTVLYAIGLFVICNVLLFILWAIRFWGFEKNIIERFQFQNCFECLDNVDVKFSTKIFADSLVYNVMFGMLFGIHFMAGPAYEYKGLYFDTNLWRYLPRLLVMILFASPAVLIKLPKSNIPALEILRSFFISLLVGYLITHPFVKLLLSITHRTEVEDNAEKIGQGEETKLNLETMPNELAMNYKSRDRREITIEP
jgi:membrane-associated phospholipid phosphatase